MRYEKSNRIVLFSKDNCGVVVNEDKSFNPDCIVSIGYYSEVFNMRHFTKFTGSLILSNEN